MKNLSKKNIEQQLKKRFKFSRNFAKEWFNIIEWLTLSAALLFAAIKTNNLFLKVGFYVSLSVISMYFASIVEGFILRVCEIKDNIIPIVIVYFISLLFTILIVNKLIASIVFSIVEGSMF